LIFELAGYGFVAFAIAGMVATRRRRIRLGAVLWIAAWLMFAFDRGGRLRVPRIGTRLAGNQ
jgi:hypothetical protein